MNLSSMAKKGVTMRLYVFAMLFFLSGCTFAVNQIHTEGTASDVVDEDQRANPTVSPTVNIPLKPLS